AALRASDDREPAVELFRKYDAVALPVVTGLGVLVGIVTVDDVMDVAEEEGTEDFQKITGMGVLEYSYFGTSFLGMIRKRLPWLILLLMAQMMTTVALTSFEHLAQFAVLVLFMPLINSPAGNTGSQMAGLMIRGLALQEMALADWSRVLRRELMRGVTLGVTLGALGYFTVLLFGRPAGIAMAVALAMVVAVTFGNLAGSMLPFLFKKLGLDPAVTSAPFLASLMDVSGIVIYFSIAVTILSILG
ncbi:MAG: magnesium transporter, partial [Phycisphaerae bacterium]|nr:magnesium transporter [Phycisphaerae bacterium]